MAPPKYLNDKLECPECGTITLEIPDGAEDGTPIHCSHCHTYLGTWGELQENFYKQGGEGVFDVNHGRFKRK